MRQKTFQERLLPIARHSLGYSYQNGGLNVFQYFGLMGTAKKCIKSGAYGEFFDKFSDTDSESRALFYIRFGRLLSRKFGDDGKNLANETKFLLHVHDSKTQSVCARAILVVVMLDGLGGAARHAANLRAFMISGKKSLEEVEKHIEAASRSRLNAWLESLPTSSR